MTKNLLYKAKSKNGWIEGYPVIKDNKLYIYHDNDFVEVEENTLCKKIDDKYFENDVFEINGMNWIISFTEEVKSYQLTRIMSEIKFTYYLPITKIKEGKYLGNIIDTPSLQK